MKKYKIPLALALITFAMSCSKEDDGYVFKPRKSDKELEKAMDSITAAGMTAQEIIDRADTVGMVRAIEQISGQLKDSVKPNRPTMLSTGLTAPKPPK